METTNTTTKQRRGFAAMSPEKQREIASKGGQAAHAKGTAHRFTTHEAKAAGHKGGRVNAQRKAARALEASIHGGN